MSLSARSRSQRKPFRLASITPTGCERPVSETLPQAVQRIAQALRPDKIILFESYAYGTPTQDSDVDLLVVMGTSCLGGTCRIWRALSLGGSN